MKCFHTTDELERGPFHLEPKPAVSVKRFTPASLAEVRLGTMKAWTGPGRFGNTFKVLGKKDHLPAGLSLCGRV